MVSKTKKSNLKAMYGMEKLDLNVDGLVQVHVFRGMNSLR